MTDSHQPTTPPSAPRATLFLGPVAYPGGSGAGAVHAEMMALDAVIRSVRDLHPGWSTSQCVVGAQALITGAGSRTVHCPARPVCLKCSAVLKALGFATGSQTTWGSEAPPAADWALGDDVRALLERCDIDCGRIQALG
ncbi:MAG: hypothetical protein Q8N44_02505 [Rubrivivax sp.]|nr:hypothetical protein [Rubrivivax sp.]